MQTSSAMTGAAFPSAARIGATAPYWILRLGTALCFIGHGAFGFITKAAWVPYFGVVGIPEDWAWKLMPVIGAVDVLAGMAVLFGPTRIPLLYMTTWALWTALLRPLAGESGFEALERAGNVGVPLAFLLLHGLPKTWRETVGALPAGSGSSSAAVSSVLQWTTVLLLLGHGALGALAGKPLLTTHYAGIGLPAAVTPLVGWLEIGLALAVALRPAPGLLLFVAFWKLVTESLFVLAGAPIWEFVERAGSYAAPAALAILQVRGRVAATSGTRSEN
jgi:hypothetical protein